MPRYNPYGNRFQQPEQYDTGEVPYISYQDPDAEKIIAQGMQNMQQRYDLTQSAMGKYMEENAKGNFSDRDYVPVMSNLNSRLEKIRQNVKDKYQGDYGAASNEVIQELGKARNIFFQAEAEKKKEDKYGPLLDKMKAEKKLLWEPGKGDPRERAAFDENGNYVPRDYSGFVEKSNDIEVAKPIIDKVSKQVKELVAQPNNYGYIEQRIAQGQSALTEPEIDKLVDEYLPVFQANTTFGIDKELNSHYKGDTRAYLKDIIKSNALDATKNEWHQNWLLKEAIDNGTKQPKPPSTPLEVGSDLQPNPWTYDKYSQNNPNITSGITILGMGNYGKFNPIPKVYDNKNYTHEQYQSKMIEQNILNKKVSGIGQDGKEVTTYAYPGLKDLYNYTEYVNSDKFDVDIVDGQVIPKISIPKNYVENQNTISIGGTSAMLGTNFLLAASKFGPSAALSAAGLTAIPLTVLGFKGDSSPTSINKAQLKEAFRKKITSEYQSKLKDASKDAFKNGPMDFGVKEFIPDIMSPSTRTNFNEFTTTFDRVIKPGNFKFEDGDYKGNNDPNSINKKYADKSGKEKPFTLGAVSGNSETGLLFKVPQADGKIATARWKTSYGVQEEYLKKIMGVTTPDDPKGGYVLMDALNGSAVDIDNKTGKISSTYSDRPIRNSLGLRAGIYNGEVISDDAPKHVLLKEDNTPLTVQDILNITKEENKKGTEAFYQSLYGEGVDVKNKPAIMDKAMMFNLLRVL